MNTRSLRHHLADERHVAVFHAAPSRGAVVSAQLQASSFGRSDKPHGGDEAIWVVAATHVRHRDEMRA